MKTEIKVSAPKTTKSVGKEWKWAVPSAVDTPDAKQEKDFVVDELFRQPQFERPGLCCTALGNSVPKFFGCGENSTVLWDMVDCDATPRGWTHGQQK